MAANRSGTGVDADALLWSLPVATAVISITATGFTFARVNPAFCRLTSLSEADCIGADHRSLLGEAAGPDGDAFLKAVVESRPAQAQVSLPTAGGAPLWVDMAAAPVAALADDRLGLLTLSDVTGLRRARDEDREAAEYLAGIVRGLPGFIFSRLVRPDGTIEHYAPEWVIDPTSRRRLITRFDPLRYVHPDDHDRLREEIDRSVRLRLPVRSEYRVAGKAGGDRWYRVLATPRQAGEDLVWDGVGIDVTEDKEKEAWLESIADNIPGFLFRRVLRPDGIVEYPYITATLPRMLGLPPEAPITPGTFWLLIHPDDREMVRATVERSTRELSRAVIECRLVASDGGERWIRSYATPRRLPTGEVAWDGVAVDVTAEKEAAQRLDYLAHHDPLTGLANRARLAEWLAALVSDVRANGGSLALSTVILSGLSEINETLGSNGGDIAFKGAAGQLSELAVGGGAFVARIDGNELAIVRRDVGPEETDDFVDSLMRALSRPIPVGGALVMMEPCIGTAYFAPTALQSLDPAAVGEELMKRASMALSSAERSGPGSRVVYSTAIDHRSHHRMQLRHAMHRAIEADEFALHYQPMVDLRTGAIVGAEALIRWDHPEFGMLRPDIFIPLAEQSGIIVAMGEWVLRRALQQLRRWHDAGFCLLTMSVNVSAIQIRTPGFPEMLRRAIAAADVPPAMVEIEITEGVLLESSAEARTCLEAVRADGVSVAIDDFGAGHASFQYLRDFPIRKLKIDQMFVRQLVLNSSDAVIVQAIATLARSLGLDLVAEGIETVEQRDFLREHGCRVGQGYLFSLPLEAEDFGWMLASHATLPFLSAPPPTYPNGLHA